MRTRSTGGSATRTVSITLLAALLAASCAELRHETAPYAAPTAAVATAPAAPAPSGTTCREAASLTPEGVPEPKRPEPGPYYPQRPTGIEVGDYPKAFPPYGAPGGGLPSPYGPGQGSKTELP